MSIYLVLKNFKGSSERGVKPHMYGIASKGSFIQAESDDSEFQRYVQEGLVRLIEKAANAEEAQAILDAEAEAAKPKPNVKSESSRPAAAAKPAAPAAAPAAPAAADTTPPAGEQAPTTENQPGSGQPIVGTAPTADVGKTTDPETAEDAAAAL